MIGPNQPDPVVLKPHPKNCDNFATVRAQNVGRQGAFFDNVRADRHSAEGKRCRRVHEVSMTTD